MKPSYLHEVHLFDGKSNKIFLKSFYKVDSPFIAECQCKSDHFIISAQELYPGEGR